MPTRDRTRNPFHRILASLFPQFGRPSTGRSLSPRDSRLRRPRLEPLEDRALLSLSGVLFVDADAVGANTGGSWTDAFVDLQDALERMDTLNSDGTGSNNVYNIWIAEGTYRPSAELEPGDPRSASFSLVDRVTLYGGFEGTEAELSERDLSGHTTTLSGDLGIVGDDVDNAYTVVYCGEGVTAGVDGVTVTGGNADTDEKSEGGGIHNTGGSLSITDSIIVRNFARSGGALRNKLGTAILERVKIADNVAWWGGGVANDGSFIAANCQISRNNAYGGGWRAAWGGAVFNSGTTLIVNSLIAGNRSTLSGGGVYSTGTTRLENSVLVGNISERGGAICPRLGSVEVVSSTVTHNVGGGIILYPHGISPTIVRNSIVAKNIYKPGSSMVDIFSYELSASNSLIGVGPSNSELADGIDGNIVGTVDSPVDPLFVRDPNPGPDEEWGTEDDDYGDLRLRPDSPAVDAGDNALLPADTADLDDDADTQEPLPLDYGGYERVVNGIVDMGAHEFGADFIHWRIYVDQDATGSGDGTSWADAFTSLDAALAFAAGLLESQTKADSGHLPDTVHEIWIADGLYTPAAERHPRRSALRDV